MLGQSRNGLPIVNKPERAPISKPNSVGMLLLASMLPLLSSPAAAFDRKHCAGLPASHTRDLDQIRYLFERLATKADRQRETRRACMLYFELDQALNISAAEYEKCGENADQIYHASKQIGVRMDALQCTAFDPPENVHSPQLALRK